MLYDDAREILLSDNTYWWLNNRGFEQSSTHPIVLANLPQKCKKLFNTNYEVICLTNYGLGASRVMLS
jgi:hypothetical protein